MRKGMPKDNSAEFFPCLVRNPTMALAKTSQAHLHMSGKAVSFLRLTHKKFQAQQLFRYGKNSVGFDGNSVSGFAGYRLLVTRT